MMRPLTGIKVLDFSTLLPGPMCTLMLAEAGADVIKVEREAGDEMRHYEPAMGADSVNFVLLNRGKRSMVADLKTPAGRALVEPLLREADVLVEQFRPGVMTRLGLDFDTVKQINPRLIYCSITGYGQTGPLAQTAAHDLNYQAQTGMLGLSAAPDGTPLVPPTLTADLAGGAYPAVINILLALRQRDISGQGHYLDISMADNLFPLMYWALGAGWHTQAWPRPAGELVTGGSPRYGVYGTADGRYLAAAPLEDKFWRNFLMVIGRTDLMDVQDDAHLRHEIARTIKGESLSTWRARFEGVDACVNEVVNVAQAVRDPHFHARGLFERDVQITAAPAVGVQAAIAQPLPALPVPVDRAFRDPGLSVAAPSLGQHNEATWLQG
ncbi:MAG: CoA transferase [Comamonadaceae bacterium]|nr:MAG: CoA transferase [Comamonadaceae bacterium]